MNLFSNSVFFSPQVTLEIPVLQKFSIHCYFATVPRFEHISCTFRLLHEVYFY